MAEPAGLLQRPGASAYTQSLSIKALAARGRLSEAYTSTMNSISSRAHRPNLVVYNSLIDACGHSGRFGHSWKAFNDMKKRGIKPSEHTIASLLNALAESATAKSPAPVDHASIAEKAWHVYGLAAKEQLDASVYVFNAMLKVGSRLGNTNVLKELFPLSGKVRCLRPDVISYTTALWNIANCGADFLLAKQYYGQLMARKDLKLDAHCFNALLAALRAEARKENPHDRTSLIAELEHAIASLDSLAIVPSNETHSLICDICRMLGCHGLGFSYLDKHVIPSMHAKHLDSFAAVALFNILILSNNSSLVFPLFEKLLTKEYGSLRATTGIVAMLLKAAHRQRDFPRADAFFRSYFTRRQRPLIPSIQAVYYYLQCLWIAPRGAAKVHDQMAWLLQWIKVAHPQLLKEWTFKGLDAAWKKHSARHPELLLLE